MKTFKKLLLLFSALLPVVSCNDDNKVEAEEPAEIVIEGVSDLTESVIFEYGEKKEWTLTSKNVSSVHVSFPEGWKAEADLTHLSVVAPSESDVDFAQGGYVVLSYVSTSGEAAKLALSVGLIKPDLTFELKVTDITSTSAKFTVIPSDKALGYYFDITRKSDFDAKDGNIPDIVETIIENYHNQQPGVPFEDMIEFMCEYGDAEEEIEGFPSDEELVVFAIGVDKTGATYGTPNHVVFKTLPPGKPEDCKFTFELKKLLATSFTTVVKPSDRSIRYWSSIEDVAKWGSDQTIPVLVKESLKQFAEAKGLTMQQVVEGATSKGVKEEEWGDMDGVERNTSYYLYAYAMDLNGDPAGPMFKHKFTTREDDLSMAEVKTAYQYFDGDALYKANPEKYPNAQGKVLVQVAAQPNEYTKDWVVALGKGDMTDPVLFPDEPTKKAMLDGGFRNQTKHQMWVDGFKEATLLSFGMDEYGIDGLLKRELINLTKEGVSPVEDVAPMSTSMSCMPFMMETLSETKREIRYTPQPVYIRASQRKF